MRTEAQAMQNTVTSMMDSMTHVVIAKDAEIKQLREALQSLLDLYIDLANSGDAGNWDPETEHEVINARDALNYNTKDK